MEDKWFSYVLQTNVDPNGSAEGINKYISCVSKKQTAAFFMAIFNKKDVSFNGNASVYNESWEI
ncbi:hypothetical protein SPD53_10860 [Oceanobacillus sp. MO10714A]